MAKQAATTLAEAVLIPVKNKLVAWAQNSAIGQVYSAAGRGWQEVKEWIKEHISIDQRERQQFNVVLQFARKRLRKNVGEGPWDITADAHYQQLHTLTIRVQVPGIVRVFGEFAFVTDVNVGGFINFLIKKARKRKTGSYDKCLECVGRQRHVYCVAADMEQLQEDVDLASGRSTTLVQSNGTELDLSKRWDLCVAPQQSLEHPACTEGQRMELLDECTYFLDG